MKKIVFFLAASLGLCLFSSCNEKKQDHKQEEVKMVSGMFTGELPCADCPGITTHITFDKNGQVAITSLYEDRGNFPTTETGTWKFDNGLIRIALPSDSVFYRVKSDSVIAMVNRAGKEVDSALRKNYLLTKQPEMDTKAFEGDYWLGGVGENAKGYRQKLVIKKLSDRDAEVTISFMGAQKGCTFTGRGKVINDQLEIPLDKVNSDFRSVMVIRFLKNNHLAVTTSREDELTNLAYFCGGGGSLAGEYQKVVDK